MHMLKKIRRSVVLTIAICALFFSTAQAEWAELFGDSFAQQFDLTTLSKRVVNSLTVSQNTIYSMMGNGTIYTYDTISRQYSVFSQVTPFPSINLDIPLTMQDGAIKNAMAAGITKIITSGNAIYGFNEMTGAIGPIDEEGIHFQKIHMDTSILFPDGSDYAQRAFYQPIIKEDRLEGWTIMDDEQSPNIWYITFSLTDGTCSVAEISGAIRICRLPEEKLLALVKKRDESIAFEVFDESGSSEGTGEYTLPLLSIDTSAKTIFDLRSIVGGMAYHGPSDTLYLTDTSHLWRSVNHHSFEAVASQVPWTFVDPYGEAQMTEQGALLALNGMISCWAEK